MSSIHVNNILDAGLLVHGKLPDIYWNLDLTGTEIKVLRYVYNNCLRLYKNLRIFPRGKDGSPRLWRGKERMADDCGLSYTTFRNNVRHLFELGVVTSMDGKDDPEEVYCIGLSADFLDNSKEFNQTVKSLRLHSLKDFISLIYDRNTLEILENTKNVDKFPLISNEIKLTETQEFGVSDISEKSSGNKKSSNSQKITRQPIYVGRQPILILPQSIKMQSAQDKLRSLQNVRTPYEKEILMVAEYYEYKCRQAIRSTGFKCLGKDFRKHKNWKYLESIYRLCQENNWDYKVYIDSQFDRVKYWEHKQLYPYLNQMFSDNAQKCFKNYLKDYQEKNSITGQAKVKSDEVKSIKQQLAEEIVKDCDGMKEWIEKAAKRRANKGLTPEQLKILYLSDHWTGLSVSYLASIPWFLTYLSQFPEESFLVDLKRDIQTVQKSNKLFNLTVEVVKKVEKQMGIPETPCS